MKLRIYSKYAILLILSGSVFRVLTFAQVSASDKGLHTSRTDNSSATPGAGILNSYLAPSNRMDLITQSGGVTGAQTDLLLYMPTVYGKDYTTFEGDVIASRGVQSAPVGDSSVFNVGDVAMAGLNLGSSISELVTITAIPDGAHITARFLNNHASGTTIGVSAKGDKIGLGISIYDNPLNKDSLFSENLNTICNGKLERICAASEMDLTNSTGANPGSFFGDKLPFMPGISLVSAGANDATCAFCVGTSGGHGFRTGFYADSATGVGLGIHWSSTGKVPVGVAVTGALHYGLEIGSNQSVPYGGNPLFPPINPDTAAILLTAQGSSGTVNSNILRFEFLRSGIAHTWDWGTLGGQLVPSYDGKTVGSSFNPDGSLSSQAGFRVVDGSNNSRGNFFYRAGHSFIQTDFVDAGIVNGQSFSTVQNCASAASPSVCDSATAGSVAVAEGSTTLLVKTTAVTANSQIQLTFDSSLSARLNVTCDSNISQPSISARNPGTGFTITMSVPPRNHPACISYMILN